MEVHNVEILLIDVKFYLYHVQKQIFNMLIKKKIIKIYNREGD